MVSRGLEGVVSGSSSLYFKISGSSFSQHRTAPVPCSLLSITLVCFSPSLMGKEVRTEDRKG